MCCCDSWLKESLQNSESEYSEYFIYNEPGKTKPETVRTYIYDLFKHWVDPNKDGHFEDGVDGFRIDHMMDDLDGEGITTNMLSDCWGPLAAFGFAI